MRKINFKNKTILLKTIPSVIAILLLLSLGIYQGATHRESVLNFEQTYLGMTPSTGEPSKAPLDPNGRIELNPPQTSKFLPREQHQSTNSAPTLETPLPEAARQILPAQKQAPPVQVTKPPLPVDHSPMSQLPSTPEQESHPAPQTQPPLLSTPSAQPMPSTTPTPSALPIPPHSAPIHETPQVLTPHLQSPQATSNIIVNNDVPNPTQPTATESASVKPQQKEPITAALTSEQHRPLTIQVKVLMDSSHTKTQKNWIEAIQQTIAEASRIYSDSFAIKLNLVGIVQWPLDTAGKNPEQLYADLRMRPRDGADVLLGLVNRQLGEDAYLKGNQGDHSPYNGSYGLAGIENVDSHLFLKGILRTLGHLLGAMEVTDTNSEEYKLGTWMSNSKVQYHWIDAVNRRRILERKVRPFPLEPRIF